MRLNSREFFADLLALCLLGRYIFISLYVYLPIFKISLVSINIVIKCSRTLNWWANPSGGGRAGSNMCPRKFRKHLGKYSELGSFSEPLNC